MGRKRGVEFSMLLKSFMLLFGDKQAERLEARSLR